MLKNWRNFFKCYLEDPELLGLWFIAVRIVFSLLLLAGFIISKRLELLDFNPDPIIFEFLPIYLGFNVLWFCAGKGKSLQRLALDGQMFVDILMITLVIYMSGGLHSELAYFYIIPIISSAMISSSAPIAAWLTSMFFYGVLIAAEHYNFIASVHGEHFGFESDEKIRISILSIITAVIVFQGVYFISRFRKKDAEVIKIKDDFIAIASHQLKTPITSMKWSLDVFKETTAPLSEKQTSALSQALDSLKNLEKIAITLLDISRIKAGKYVKTKQRIELNGFINDLIKAVTPYAKSMGKSVELSSTESFYINTDPKMLYDMVINLVTNAIKYSPSDKPVRIFVEKENKNIKIRVLNFGPVITTEEKKRLFEQFYRGEKSQSVSIKDTGGLGLYIVKLYTENLGGRVGFKSEEDFGTEFWFSLPLNGQN